jgi:hypothetical protein
MKLALLKEVTMRKWCAKISRLLCLSVLSVFCLSACGNPTMPPPTPTLAPTDTPLPATATPPQNTLPTATRAPPQIPLPQTTLTTRPTVTPMPITPTPRATTTPQAVNPVATVLPPFSTLTLGKTEISEVGGFSFQPLRDFRTAYDVGVVVLTSIDDAINISLASTTEEDTRLTSLALSDFVDNISQNATDFKLGLPASITLDKANGYSVELTGKFPTGGTPMTGKLVVVSPAPKRLFFAFMIAEDGADGKGGERGRQAFELVLPTIKFMAQSTTPCDVASDKTYGYTKENPIRVGGDILSGPARERAYLDNLLSPQDETLLYERKGSLSAGGKPLDLYEARYPGLTTPLVLYFDIYNYHTPLAPVGLTCDGPIPFKE